MTPLPRLLLCLAAVAVSLLGSTPSVLAGPGDLDRSFSGDGRVATPFDGDSVYASQVLLQPDGNVVAVGSAGVANKAQIHRSFALARYLPDGEPDLSFGSAGRVTFGYPGQPGFVHNPADTPALAAALQPDGKILAAGYSSSQAIVVRFNADGSIDETFGSDGVVRTDFGSNLVGGDVISALALQPDGRIVAAGFVRYQTGNSDVAFARYLPDGGPDPSFSDDGVLVIERPGQPLAVVEDAIATVAIQPDGRIVAAGRLGWKLAALRLNSDGTLDASFGEGGEAILVNRSLTGRGLALQGDGRLVIVGDDSYGHAALARLTQQGSLDRRFSSDGLVFERRVHSLTAVAVGAKGRIVAAGSTKPGGGGKHGFAVLRYTRRGRPDGGFSRDGLAVTDFGRLEAATDVVIQANGRIVAAGGAVVPDPAGGEWFHSFALARYRG